MLRLLSHAPALGAPEVVRVVWPETRLRAPRVVLIWLQEWGPRRQWASAAHTLGAAGSRAPRRVGKRACSHKGEGRGGVCARKVLALLVTAHSAWAAACTWQWKPSGRPRLTGGVPAVRGSMEAGAASTGDPPEQVVTRCCPHAGITLEEGAAALRAGSCRSRNFIARLAGHREGPADARKPRWNCRSSSLQAGEQAGSEGQARRRAQRAGRRRRRHVPPGC